MTYLLLILSSLMCMLAATSQQVVAQTQDTLTHNPQVSELSNQLKTVMEEVLILKYGIVENGEEIEQDLSHLVVSDGLTFTLIMKGFAPAGSEPLLPELNSYPLISWVVHVENTSDHYQVADSLLKQVQVLEERDGIFSYTPTHVAVTDASAYNLIPPPYPNPFLIAPNSSLLLFIIQPIDNPFSHYHLTSLASDQELMIPAYEVGLDDLLQHAFATTQTLHTEESYYALIEDLQTHFLELEQTLQETQLVAHDNFLEEQGDLQKVNLNQTLADNLTLVQHGQIPTGDQQTELYWIFETTNTTNDLSYAAQALWPIQAEQKLSNSTDKLGVRITPVLETPAGNYMPSHTPLEHSLVPSGWTGHFKVSIQRVSTSYDYYLDYNGTLLDSYTE